MSISSNMFSASKTLSELKLLTQLKFVDLTCKRLSAKLCCWASIVVSLATIRFRWSVWRTIFAAASAVNASLRCREAAPDNCWPAAAGANGACSPVAGLAPSSGAVASSAKLLAPSVWRVLVLSKLVSSGRPPKVSIFESNLLSVSFFRRRAQLLQCRE